MNHDLSGRSDSGEEADWQVRLALRDSIERFVQKTAKKRWLPGQKPLTNIYT